MKVKRAYCLFEQSGTFKNEFKKLGIPACDYDILNDFYETEYQIDLFKEIIKAYDNSDISIFDGMKSDELIIAFFPCVRFEQQVLMYFRGDNFAQRNWTDLQKLEYDLKLHNELNELYQLITKLVIVCMRKKIPLIIENPYSSQHYLTKYWALKPTIIDTNRRLRGDFYEKPTQFWFVNCKPANNFLFEAIDIPPKKNVEKVQTVERSMISKQYANRFIREFILD